MSAQYKPTGYNSVSPYFVVPGAKQLIDLLHGIFKATELRRYDMPDGTIMHAELRIDDTVIMLGDSSEQYPPMRQVIHVYVPDARETYKKALELGCVSLQPPSQKEGDPDLRGSFKDFAGNIWSVGTQINS